VNLAELIKSKKVEDRLRAVKLAERLPENELPLPLRRPVVGPVERQSACISPRIAPMSQSRTDASILPALSIFWG